MFGKPRYRPINLLPVLGIASLPALLA